MMPTTQRMEDLSRAYVRALAARAGVLCGKPEDDFGLDLFLRGVERDGPYYLDSGPQVDIQLKSTTRAEVRGATILYDLDVRAYELLRRVDYTPRILVLLVLPAEEVLWLEQSAEQLILRRCAYWLSLREAAPTPNQATIRVSIPQDNIFSVQTIIDMTTR
jgi:hypothetical protein